MIKSININSIFTVTYRDERSFSLMKFLITGF